MVLDQKTVFIADYESGVKVVDISNIYQPKLLNTLNTKSYAEDIIISQNNDKLYVADGWSGLVVVDI